IAAEAAGDAVVAVLRRLDSFRGESRFTTWAYKFALYETAVKFRRRSWQGREIPVAEETWATLAPLDEPPDPTAEPGALLAAIRNGIADELTPHQRDVLLALAVEGVPVDVLADRLGTTRGALYKTLHDARRKLRAHLAACGLSVEAR